MNHQAQQAFLDRTDSLNLNNMFDDQGFRDLASTQKGTSFDPMKALLIQSLLKHPKTRTAGKQPKIVSGSAYNDQTLVGGGVAGKSDDETATLVKRDITRGKYNLNYHINTPAMQERLAALQSYKDITLVAGGFEYDKIPFLAQQTLRNLGGSKVLVLVHHRSAIKTLEALTSNRNQIKYLTHHEALNFELKNKLSQFNAIILSDLQIRSTAIDLWLYLIKHQGHGGNGDGEGGAGTRKYLLVSHGLHNGSIVNYLGGSDRVGIMQIMRQGQDDQVRIYTDYAIPTREQKELSGLIFWKVIFSRIAESIQKIYMEGYRESDGNIVVFLPNHRSIKECHHYLNERLGDLLGRLTILRENDLIISGQKTIVYLTTQIPSVVPRVGHVIDSGLQIVRSYSPQTRIHYWKLDYIDDLSAKEREALASIAVFKLYPSSATGRPELVEILRSPVVDKYMIKLLDSSITNQNKTELKRVMTKQLISPISLDRFLDFWEPLEEIGVITNKKRDSSRLTFLAKECFQPLDLDISLCAVLLMGRKIIQNLNFLAEIVAILSIGGSVRGSWIYDPNLINQYQNPQGDVFGLHQLFQNRGQFSRSQGGQEQVNHSHLTKVQDKAQQIGQKLQSLDELCLIVPQEKIVGDNDIHKMVQILFQVYGEKHLVTNNRLGGKKIKLKKGLIPGSYKDDEEQRYLALELKNLTEFRERAGTLYGNMVVNLDI